MDKIKEPHGNSTAAPVVKLKIITFKWGWFVAGLLSKTCSGFNQCTEMCVSTLLSLVRKVLFPAIVQTCLLLCRQNSWTLKLTTMTLKPYYTERPNWNSPLRTNGSKAAALIIPWIIAREISSRLFCLYFPLKILSLANLICFHFLLCHFPVCLLLVG